MNFVSFERLVIKLYQEIFKSDVKLVKDAVRMSLSQAVAKNGYAFSISICQKLNFFL